MSPCRFRFVGHFTLLAVFFAFFLYPASGSLQDVPVYLTPPGLRSVKDPSLVIPASHSYPNLPPAKPVYRNATGSPAKGWAAQYVGTRRFSSDRSAWIYYRVSDREGSATLKSSPGLLPLRIWPAGTTIVLESYQGDAVGRNSAQLIETLVMHKVRDKSDMTGAFYPANWCYAGFTPQGAPSLSVQKVAECHQCHRIAFHLTGDLTFTQFP